MTQNDASPFEEKNSVLGAKTLTTLGEDVGRLIDDNSKEWWPMTKAVGMQVKGAVKSEGFLMEERAWQGQKGACDA